MGIPPTNPHPPQSSSFYDPHFLKLLLVLGVRLETEPIIDPRNWRFGPQYEYNIFAIVSWIRRKEVGRSTQSRQCFKKIVLFSLVNFSSFYLLCWIFNAPDSWLCFLSWLYRIPHVWSCMGSYFLQFPMTPIAVEDNMMWYHIVDMNSYYDAKFKVKVQINHLFPSLFLIYVWISSVYLLIDRIFLQWQFYR